MLVIINIVQGISVEENCRDQKKKETVEDVMYSTEKDERKLKGETEENKEEETKELALYRATKGSKV